MITTNRGQRNLSTRKWWQNPISNPSRLIRLLLLLLVYAVAGVGPLLAQNNTNKWLQIPDASQNGLDVYVPQNQWLADDFLCRATGPITEIRVWGSWLNNQVPPPTAGPCFCLSIWSDVPRLGTCPSHPGALLCTNCFLPGAVAPIVYATGVNEQFYDPTLGILLGADTIIYEYIFTIPASVACWQTNGNIYWLGLQASCYDTNLYRFGWKTCPTNWNDDAAFTTSATNTACAIPSLWQELFTPDRTRSLDLAFQLLTTPTNPPPPPPTNNVDKWLQIPDTSPNGLDVRATSPKVLASDFLCTQTGPISQIRFWASWNNDKLPPVPPCFCLGIWTDVPGGPGNPSHPGQLICSNCFNQCQYTYFPYTNCVNEQFWDPNTGNFLGLDTTIWEYIFNWPTNRQCYQTNGNIYWVSLTADCFDQSQYQFGWKTCPTNWNDDSVYGDAPFGSTPPFWVPLVRPGTNTSLDLAFEIFTATNPPSPVPPPTPTNTVDKWLQIPDTSLSGLDVKATDPKILASDFLCNNTGPISQIRVWGSWRNDQLPPTPPCFCLGIWSDSPAGPTGGYSHPASLLCRNCFYQCQYTYFPYTNCVNEQFFDPNINQITGADTVIWEYIFDWPSDTSLCIQTNGNVYWLSLAVDCVDTNLYNFGWKTSPTNWNDDSVYGDAPFGSTPPFWIPLVRPSTTNSLDLAFEVITRTNNQPPPPPTNNYKWLQIPDTSTNGIDVRATTQKILADDFRCTATGPITEIRVWTSWLNNIVDTNACFCLGLWTDIPQTGTNYSRPGQQLCNWCFFPGQYTNFIYTNVVFERFWDPNLGTNGFLGFDTQIWEYIFRIPTNTVCTQTNGNIYWLSLTADCIQNPEAIIGWKTCPTNFNDDAVFGDGPFGGGPPPTGWFPLVRPFFTNSLDLAFEIITGTNPCAPPTITCPPDKTVECGTLWPIDFPIVTDPCCGALFSLTYAAVTNGVCPQLITFTWTMSDCVGATLYCTQAVTVVDTTPPVLTCAPNKTVQCGPPWSFDPPSAFDLCCGTNVTITVVSTITNSSCQAIRTWQARDCCSNSINCSQIVTINDTNRPTIICPTNILVLTCSTNIAVSWSIIATDACTSVTVTSTPPSGSLFNRDTTNTVVAVATDACGNTNSCSFLVVVRRPALTISITGAPPVIKVTWVDGGVLQTTTNLLVPSWADLPLATSPYTVSPTNLARFYRLRCP